MSRYIDKDLLLKQINSFISTEKHTDFYNCGYDDCICAVQDTIADMPEADVIEVKHGKCIKNAPNPDKMVEFHKLGIGKAMSVNSIFWTCSECGKWINPRDNYCPNCGARMDGDKQ